MRTLKRTMLISPFGQSAFYRNVMEMFEDEKAKSGIGSTNFSRSSPSRTNTPWRRRDMKEISVVPAIGSLLDTRCGGPFMRACRLRRTKARKRTISAQRTEVRNGKEVDARRKVFNVTTHADRPRSEPHSPQLSTLLFKREQ